MMATAAEPVAHRKAAATVGGGPESILQRHLRVASERPGLSVCCPVSHLRTLAECFRMNMLERDVVSG